MDARVADALARLPEYFGEHVLVSVTAMLLGLAISLPLAIASLRRPALRAGVLAATSIVQTIPGLALLALFYPLLLGAAALTERTLGFGFSALGFLPAVLALTLYTMLPVVRNTITGIDGSTRPSSARPRRRHDRAAALHHGRAAAGAAGDHGGRAHGLRLGDRHGDAFDADRPDQPRQLHLCRPADAELDFRAVRLRRCGGAGARGRPAAGADRARVFRAQPQPAGCRRDRPCAYRSAGPRSPTCRVASGGYVIGAKPFAEQYILAALMEDRLRAQGLAATRRDGLGSAVVFDALAAGDIDAYVDYSGTIWANQMHRTDVVPREQVLAEVAAWLKERHGIVMLGGLGFENAYALAMTRKRAADAGIGSIADLARHAPTLSIAGDYEFFGRPEWKAIRDTYGLSFRQQRQMQAEFMYPAVAAGEIDVISAYTSDGRVAQFGLQVLDDPKHAIPPYDAILLVSPKRASDRAFLDALRPLIGKISVDVMREANRRAGEGASPEVAARWLAEKIGR